MTETPAQKKNKTKKTKTMKDSDDGYVPLINEPTEEIPNAKTHKERRVQRLVSSVLYCAKEQKYIYPIKFRLNKGEELIVDDANYGLKPNGFYLKTTGKHDETDREKAEILYLEDSGVTELGCQDLSILVDIVKDLFYFLLKVALFILLMIFVILMTIASNGPKVAPGMLADLINFLSSLYSTRVSVV
jgi:hypothetical protein